VLEGLFIQINYPRSPSIRGKWLGRRLFELVIMLTTLVLLLHQVTREHAVSVRESQEGKLSGLMLLMHNVHSFTIQSKWY
jgi:hypothetical protein